MNYKNILFKTLIFSTIIIFIMDLNKPLDMFIVLFISFVSCYLYDLFILKSITPRITKDIDEMIHPVTDTLKVLHLVYLEKHYGKQYNKKFVEKCSCGSTIFRVYNEETDKGMYIQHICALCNTKATGIEIEYKI